MGIIHKVPKIRHKKYKSFCPSIKMQNLSRKELRLIAKNRNICGYKSMPKDKLSRIIIMKRQKESF